VTVVEQWLTRLLIHSLLKNSPRGLKPSLKGNA
jgi:hypothetical protein